MKPKNIIYKLGTDVIETKYNIIGWVIFIICSIFFLASSIKNRDMYSFIGSILFLLACFVFLIPLLKSEKEDVEKK